MRSASLAAVLTLLTPPALAEEASFFDDFDRLNTVRWLVSDGWKNGHWMNCVWSFRAVGLSGGILSLRLGHDDSSDHAFRCGEIQSRSVFGHGTYEIRMRTARGSGQNAAFFTYTGPHFGDPHDEIDIEVLLQDPSAFQVNTYVSAKPANGHTISAPVETDQDFQSYGFTWAPDRITWFLNGTEVHRTLPGSKLPVTPQRIFASLWSSDTFTDWMGAFDPQAVPSQVDIDWIAFTALGDDCRFPESLLCEGTR